MQIVTLHHATLVVKDLAAADRFYGTILGLRSIPKPGYAKPGRWYQCGANAQLHLIAGDEPTSPGQAHLALEVDDFAGLVVALKRHAVQVTEGPAKRDDGSDYLYCRDPDGNLLEATHHPV
jgi:catechol 2,3-dioxygenase-like lactoylglutathione lyase family enzyme